MRRSRESQELRITHDPRQEPRGFVAWEAQRAARVAEKAKLVTRMAGVEVLPRRLMKDPKPSRSGMPTLMTHSYNRWTPPVKTPGQQAAELVQLGARIEASKARLRTDSVARVMERALAELPPQPPENTEVRLAAEPALVHA